MINLLPAAVKQGNTYGARNRVLVRWVVAFLIGIFGIFAVVVFGHYQLNRSIAATEEQISQSELRLKEQNIEETQTQTESIDNSIKLALQVLEQKVLFSRMLQDLGASMPEGAVLSDISVQEIEGGLNLTAYARDYQTATQVHVNINDPTASIFKSADIITAQCISAEQGETQSAEQAEYPCTITLRALFKEDNPYLFINSGGVTPQGASNE